MNELERTIAWANDILYYGYFGYDDYGDYGLTGYYSREVKQDYDASLQFERDYKDSENKAEYLINFSIEFAERHFDELMDSVKRATNSEDVPADAVIIAAAAEVYKTIHKDLISRRAYFYADDYAEKDNTQGNNKSKRREYERYLEGNNLSISTCAYRVAKAYLRSRKSITR